MSSSWIASRIVAAALGIAMGASGYASTAAAQGTALQRPIEDFLAAQGSGTPPPGFTANFIGWVGRTGPKADLSRIMTLDYAGLDAAAVGLPLPEMRGSVTERPLASGMTNVKVTLRTRDALAYVHRWDGPAPIPPGPVLFGLTPPEAAADPAGAAYGSSILDVDYNVARAPGGPMEDLILLFFGGLPYDSLPLFVSFSGSADGELRAASGCPEGTSGRAWTVQTGLILAGIHNGFKGALGDAFPAEWVEIRPECN
jgi:hypothetical protein